MSKVSALWTDLRRDLLKAVAAGEATPAAVAHAIVSPDSPHDLAAAWDAAWEHVNAALSAGGRRKCQNCGGKGSISTRYTGGEQTCVVCDGKGSVA